jgi:hypothetical protein
MTKNNAQKTPPSTEMISKAKWAPIIKWKGGQLLTVRSFSIIRNEKTTYQYLITLDLPHDGEINPMQLTTDNSDTLSIEFKKHTESYRGSWVNYAIRWQEEEEPLLVLYFTCTRVSN